MPRLLVSLSLAVLLALPAAAQEAAPKLDLTKSAYDEEVSVGDEAVFFIAVTNAGTAAATGVVVGDVLPMGLRFAAARPTRDRYEPATGQWTIGPLAAGESEALELVTVFDAEMPVQNCASAHAADQADSVTACASVRPKREKMVPLAAHVSPDSR